MTTDRSFEIAGDRAKNEIALVQEFRTRLITDVVTGKLDIRAAATKASTRLRRASRLPDHGHSGP